LWIEEEVGRKDRESEVTVEVRTYVEEPSESVEFVSSDSLGFTSLPVWQAA
jgi:hypothetical protein